MVEFDSGRIIGASSDFSMEALVTSISTLHNNLSRFFAEKIASAAPVERIYMSFFEKEIDMWTVLREDTEKQRKELYKIELELVRRFREFSFDFHIYSLADVNLNEFEKDPNVFSIYPF